MNFLKFSSVLFLFMVSAFLAENSFAFENNLALPKTLHESIMTSILNNPETQSIDKQLEVIHLQTQSVKDQVYPSAQMSCDYSRNNYKDGYQGQGYQDSSSNSKGCQIGLSMDVFDSGATEHSIKSAEALEQAARYRFNTMSSYMQYTKGNLAARTLEAYISLITYQKIISELEIEGQYLKSVSLFAKSEADKNSINSQIANYESNLLSAEQSYNQAITQFEKEVTTEPAPVLESLEMTINKLVIPSTANEAINIARQKNPDFKAAESELEAVRENTKSIKANFGPHVSIYVSKGYSNSVNNTVYDGLPYKSNSTTVGVNVSMQLSVPSLDSLKSSQKREESVRLDQDTANKNMEFQINNFYVQLSNAQTMLKLIINNYELAKKSIDDILNQLNSPNPDPDGKLINNAISANNIRNNAFNQLYGPYGGYLSNIVRIKYSIQQQIGTVFEDMNKDVSGK